MSFSINKTPSVSKALETRITCRDFLDKPVPNDVLKRVLHTSLRSASGGNLQPWKIHIIQGETLKKFKKTCVDRMMAGKVEEPTYPAYPSPLWEPQRSWRYKLGEDMYALWVLKKIIKWGD